MSSREDATMADMYEYYCPDCHQLRLHARGRSPRVCGNCGSEGIDIDEVGSARLWRRRHPDDAEPAPGPQHALAVLDQLAEKEGPRPESPRPESPRPENLRPEGIVVINDPRLAMLEAAEHTGAHVIAAGAELTRRGIRCVVCLFGVASEHGFGVQVALNEELVSTTDTSELIREVQAAMPKFVVLKLGIEVRPVPPRPADA
jgi:hypothetical protein